ncbi:tRNA epoxyqueuosine(34) reductase QueG [Taibaiella chishuiensis]|uniref:Epoxyqueuosine reductase n=1 Tax=Taibaiella chishuiensis TaxID=1434707 RepID=A0A2P8D1K9_9BACT|nr:tRNA epoxyqueuosine(34) reductase QueG [Taibaiella chishuiensis]PSK91099.1 epoxyqueuosine reductase [Taibaiella chishuiensis]
MNLSTQTTFIKTLSRELGFDYCGIARAQRLDDDARKLEQWLTKGYQGKMGYMENHFDMRVDPTLLVPGAKSVVTLLLNYYPEEQQAEGAPKIAKYAYGTDYHLVIREKMNEFLYRIREKIGQVEGRGFVDSAPVLERSWAVRSGLGWVGKNGNLIHKQTGSFFFIATLIIDLELEYDDPFAKDYCGSCTRCLDACPTGAIVDPTLIDGSRCISYLTIELKDELIAPEFRDKMEGWMFGCDICQDVCPWNRFARPHQQDAFAPIPLLLNLGTAEWEAMDEQFFRTLLKNSPMKRSKWKGIQRNIRFLENPGKI